MIQGVSAVRDDLLILVRRGRDDRVVREGLRKEVEQIGQAAWMVRNERTCVEVVDEFEVFNGVDAAIGEGCWWGGGLGWTFMLVKIG